MSEHEFRKGDRVAIFNATFSGRPIFEGYAFVIRTLDADNHYLVRFDIPASIEPEIVPRFAFPGEQQIHPDEWLLARQEEFDAASPANTGSSR